MANKEEIGTTEWIPKVHKSNDDDYFEQKPDETSFERLIRKCTETPFVPIGLFATVGALTYGLYQFKRGKSAQQQYAMRARVGFQGLTIAALGYSMYWQNKKMSKEKKEKS